MKKIDGSGKWNKHTAAERLPLAAAWLSARGVDNAGSVIAGLGEHLAIFWEGVLAGNRDPQKDSKAFAQILSAKHGVERRLGRLFYLKEFYEPTNAMEMPSTFSSPA